MAAASSVDLKNGSVWQRCLLSGDAVGRYLLVDVFSVSLTTAPNIWPREKRVGFGDPVAEVKDVKTQIDEWETKLSEAEVASQRSLIQWSQRHQVP
jgi:hypothetical protein